MNMDMINYWLKVFQETNPSYQSSDNKVIHFSELLETLKDLKIQNVQLQSKLKQRDFIISEVRHYVSTNSNIYLNIMNNKIGFFKNHDTGSVPIDLLKILNKLERRDD